MQNSFIKGKFCQKLMLSLATFLWDDHKHSDAIVAPGFSWCSIAERRMQTLVVYKTAAIFQLVFLPPAGLRTIPGSGIHHALKLSTSRSAKGRQG
jgi:hypothetical protein